MRIEISVYALVAIQARDLTMFSGVEVTHLADVREENPQPCEVTLAPVTRATLRRLSFSNAS